MNTKYSFENLDEARMVYVRAVSANELPDDVRSQVGELDVLYAVHRPDGERLALVKDRDMAFILARQNDLAPVTVH